MKLTKEMEDLIERVGCPWMHRGKVYSTDKVEGTK